MPRLDAIPRRIVTLALPPPYDVLTVKAWVSYPRSLLEGPGVVMDRDVFAQVIVEHDILGPDDKPLPVGVPEFWDAIPQDLSVAIWRAVLAQVGNFTTPASSGTTSSGGASRP